jgi:long-chain acyl-CoA synthetase
LETLVDLIREASLAYGDRQALSIRAGLRSDHWSYRRLWDAANAVGNYLRNDQGLAPGDRILVWGPNSPQLVAAHLGAILARIVLVPLDAASTQQFITRVAEKTQAAVIIASGPLPGGLGLRVVRLEDLPFDLQGKPLDENVKGEDVAEIIFTSGTTGEPKGVVLSHRNITANVAALDGIFPRGPHYRLMSLLPLSHMLEQTGGLYLPLSYGATVYYPVSRQSSVIFKTLKRQRIVSMVLVPQVLDIMLKGIEREARRSGRWRQWVRAHRLATRLPIPARRWLFRSVHRRLGGSLKFLICGGAHLPGDLMASWERLGVPVIQGYGATECAPVVTSNSLRVRGDGVGKPIPGVTLRISAENEVQVMGANVTSGYWDDPVASEAAFTADGWYRTGDLGEMDSQGCLRLKGRLKDLIVLPSGLNVYPEDVERVLGCEQGITDCVVLGMPDTSGNLRVHAAVLVSDAGDTGQDANELVQAAVRRANANLAPHQQISGFNLWKADDFPRTALRKVKRHEVRAVLAGAGPQQGTLPPTPSDEALARVQRILGEVCDVSATTITPETDFNLDLRLDSLSRVELAVVLEEELGVALDEEEIAQLRTVAHLMELLDRSGDVRPPLSFPTWALQTPARAARALLQSTLVFPIHSMFCRPFHIRGREHLQELTLPALFIANHSSHVDTVSIRRALPPWVRRNLAIAAATDYFYRDQALGAAFSLLLNTFPFSREGAVRASLEYCGDLADAGWSLLVYPEGTRSPTGELLPFKSGIGLLAQQLRLPVVPISVEGGHRVLPKGRSIPRPGPVTVRFGQPIRLPRSEDYLATAKALEAEVAQLMVVQRRSP